jgi:hypothetical protein
LKKLLLGGMCEYDEDILQKVQPPEEVIIGIEAVESAQNQQFQDINLERMNNWFSNIESDEDEKRSDNWISNEESDKDEQ